MRWTRLSRTTCVGTLQVCGPTTTVFCCWTPTTIGVTPSSSDSPRWGEWKTQQYLTVGAVLIQVGILCGSAAVESMKTIGQRKSRFHFSQLRFERSEVMNWGLNFGREIARKQEIDAWHEAPKTYGGLAKYRTAYFGTLEGLEGITPSRRLELLPYVLPGASYESSTEETDGVFEAGLDLKYGVTPNLTADLTVNTDFAPSRSRPRTGESHAFLASFSQNSVRFSWKVLASSMSGSHVRVSVDRHLYCSFIVVALVLHKGVLSRFSAAEK